MLAALTLTEEAGEMQQVGVDVRELVRSQCSRGVYTYDVGCGLRGGESPKRGGSKGSCVISVQGDHLG